MVVLFQKYTVTDTRIQLLPPDKKRIMRTHLSASGLFNSGMVNTQHSFKGIKSSVYHVPRTTAMRCGSRPGSAFRALKSRDLASNLDIPWSTSASPAGHGKRENLVFHICALYFFVRIIPAVPHAPKLCTWWKSPKIRTRTWSPSSSDCQRRCISVCACLGRVSSRRLNELIGCCPRGWTISRLNVFQNE